MNTTTVKDAGNHRRVTVAIAGSAILLVVAVALLLIVGIRHVPVYPGIRAQPLADVTGRLAIRSWSNDAGMCIDVEEIATGERRRIHCEGFSIGESKVPAGINWFDWTDDGRLLLASYDYEGETVVLFTIDPDTGDVLSEEVLPASTRPPDKRAREDGSTLVTRSHEGGRTSVSVLAADGSVRLVEEVRGPDGYAFWTAQWSPRGDHAVVSDSEQRWIVFRVEGDPEPRILTERADQVAWYQP